jgi:sugar phosphate isomerase/epimerase
MRPIGFSTGALAKGDFSRAIRLLKHYRTLKAIELSALRDHELAPLVEAVPKLDLKSFDYVSFHAPSKLGDMDEVTAADLLLRLPEAWAIVVHPDILRTTKVWTRFGGRLCVENMDNRKTTGRTVAELRDLFQRLPAATFCLDVGHAKQIDPTMASAILMLREFGDRLRQVHMSDVGARGEHFAIGVMARLAFSRLAAHVPRACPIIIESVIESSAIEHEVRTATDAFEEKQQDWKLSAAVLSPV